MNNLSAYLLFDMITIVNVMIAKMWNKIMLKWQEKNFLHQFIIEHAIILTLHDLYRKPKSRSSKCMNKENKRLWTLKEKNTKESFECWNHCMKFQWKWKIYFLQTKMIQQWLIIRKATKEHNQTLNSSSNCYRMFKRRRLNWNHYYFTTTWFVQSSINKNYENKIIYA